MPDHARHVVRVRCEVMRSAFSGERLFIVPGYSLGCAPVHYCFLPDGSPIGDLPAEGETLTGLVVGVAFARAPEGSIVEMPDGEVYVVTDDQIVTVPDELETLRAENDRLKAEVGRLSRQRTILFRLAVGHRLGRGIVGDTRESVEAETREVAVMEKEIADA